MIKLNPNTWFVRSYLDYHKDYLPNNVCQLVNRFIRQTLLYVVIALAGLLLLGSYILAWRDMIGWLFFDKTLEESGGIAFWVAYHALALILFIMSAYSKWRSNRAMKRFLEGQRMGVEPQRSALTVTMTGLWDKFKNKTCTMITWDDA